MILHLHPAHHFSPLSCIRPAQDLYNVGYYRRAPPLKKQWSKDTNGPVMVSSPRRTAAAPSDTCGPQEKQRSTPVVAESILRFLILGNDRWNVMYFSLEHSWSAAGRHCRLPRCMWWNYGNCALAQTAVEDGGWRRLPRRESTGSGRGTAPRCGRIRATWEPEKKREREEERARPSACAPM